MVVVRRPLMPAAAAAAAAAADDDDEYTNLYLSSLLPAAFYSYIPHFPSPAPSFTISLYIIGISHV